MINIDMWYGNKIEEVTKIDISFYGDSGEYRGNIYIPLNTNTINSMNADQNEIKASTAKKYEEMQQDWIKDNNKGPSGSYMLS